MFKTSDLTELFERKNAADEVAKKQEKLTAQLELKVGCLIIEKDFLGKSAINWRSTEVVSHKSTGLGQLFKSPLYDPTSG